MRIVAGIARGRRLRAPKGRLVRPTADRVKEAVFSMLESRESFEGCAVLDLFAGAGTLGLEALSRGAREAVFVDPARAASEAITANLTATGLVGEVLTMPADRAIRHLAASGRRFDRVFIDPPYGQGWVERTLAALDESELVVDGGWVVVEHGRGEPAARTVGRFSQELNRRYGDTNIAFYRAGASRTGEHAGA
ncbi:MAG: 16S rRNA (guanine(966)-N(2))-methyltransferase RsmD [Deltaproteobacteria bacterium]|nr:16S rRNA (guanine(966)-N(2))-methyltransferase RsmD [Deltaproteobacteria bacterium]